MSEGQIRIRVGATADRSIEAVFGSVEKRAIRAKENVSRAFGANMFAPMGQAAERAASQVERAQKRQGDAAAREAARASREVQRHYNEQLRTLNRVAREQDRIVQRQAREEQRALQASERAAESAARRKIALQNRSFAMEQRERERASRAVERAAREEDRVRARFAYRTAYHGVVRYFPGAMGHVARGMSDIMRGAGVDFSVPASVGRVVQTQGQITELQNQASFAGQTVSRPQLTAAIKGTADKFGYSREEAADALQVFAGKSGDMGLGMALFNKVAERAAASGTKLSDAMSMSADVAANLGPEVRDKIGATIGVLDTAIVQGAKGAVELKDLAVHEARISSAAGRYEGGAAGNMVKLQALAQLARQSGGAATAAEATTSVSRLTDQFATPARIKQFKAMGIDVFSKTEKGQIADPFKIIEAALLKTGGDPEKMRQLFASSIGAKPAQALATTFNKAGGGDAGIAAVQSQLAAFMGAVDIEAKVRAANALREQDIGVKAKRFMNALDDITERTMASLAPTLEELAPKIQGAADVFGRFVSWAAENPWEAGAAAFAASIARAGWESTVREALEKGILNGTAGGIKIPGGVTLAAGAVAITAAIVALDQAQGLKDQVGADSWLGMLPGFNGKGEWGGFDQLFKEFNINPGEMYFKKAEANMNSAAQEKARAEGWDPNSEKVRLVRELRETGAENKVPVELAQALAREFGAVLARGVRVTNPGDFRDGKGQGPRVDHTGRDPH